MKEIRLDADKTHYCTSYREGYFIVWKCPICDKYEGRFNWLTGEMKASGTNEFNHIGISTQKENLEGLTQNLQDN